MPANSILDADYHMGHLFFDCMRQKPDGVCQLCLATRVRLMVSIVKSKNLLQLTRCQKNDFSAVASIMRAHIYHDRRYIDAATEQEESHASVLSRSIRLAQFLRNQGFKPGDVLALSGINHLDVHIPYYAALMNGFPVCGVDPQFKLDEIKSLFQLIQPKIAFCDSENYDIYVNVAKELNFNTRVFSFTGKNSMAEMIASCGEDQVSSFEPTVFDLDKVYAWLITSGGTTGVLKVVAIKHRKWIGKVLKSTNIFGQESKTGQKIGLNLSPIQWASGFFNAIAMPLLSQIKLQTSAPATSEHVIDIINKYKPTNIILGPPLLISILRNEKECDFTCFNVIVVTGGKIFNEHLIELAERKRDDAMVLVGFGQTENVGEVFKPNPNGPLGNCGQLSDIVKVKLVDPETGKEVTEPLVPGELWTEGATFTEYYNDPKETARVFTKDGWFKTGDIFYRDENNNFFFQERLTLIIKYKSNLVRPLELEELIRTLPGVLDVAVTAVPDPNDGGLPAACVVREKGSNVTAQKIRDIVANKLSDPKQLRGGVVFVEQIPLTTTGKVARSKLFNLVLESERE